MRIRLLYFLVITALEQQSVNLLMPAPHSQCRGEKIVSDNIFDATLGMFAAGGDDCVLLIKFNDSGEEIPRNL